jgi:hypothetical protein
MTTNNQPEKLKSAEELYESNWILFDGDECKSSAIEMIKQRDAQVREAALREAAEIARNRKRIQNTRDNDRRNACLEETANAILSAIQKKG